MARLLDEALPEFDVNEVHSAWLAVAPERAYDAARHVTVSEIRLLLPLMAVRLLPAALLRRSLPAARSGPVLDAMVGSGFALLGERAPDEVAVGAVGRFWLPTAGDSPRSVDGLDGFAGFDEPGYAKGATDFRVVAEGAGSRVITETRVATTDDAARRSFARYWRLIGIGSGLIRVSWLNAIARRAAEPRGSARTRGGVRQAV